MDIKVCKNCSNRFVGNYCNNCGEKVYSAHDKKLSHILDEALHFITHFNGSFFTTLKTVLFRPGKLSLDYCEGIRKKYFKPISFFLFCIIIYLLLSTFSQSFRGLNMSFSSYVNPDYEYRNAVISFVKMKMAATGMTADQLAKKYNDASPGFAKIMLLVYLPLVGLTFKLLYFRRRLYYFDHLIFATEFVSFYVFFIFLLTSMLALIVSAIYPPGRSWFTDKSVLGPVFQLIILIWIVVASKRFYQQSWVWTIVKAIAFLVLFFFVISYIYNLILFFAVLYFIN